MVKSGFDQHQLCWAIPAAPAVRGRSRGIRSSGSPTDPQRVASWLGHKQRWENNFVDLILFLHHYVALTLFFHLCVDLILSLHLSVGSGGSNSRRQAHPAIPFTSSNCLTGQITVSFESNCVMACTCLIAEKSFLPMWAISLFPACDMYYILMWLLFNNKVSFFRWPLCGGFQN